MTDERVTAAPDTRSTAAFWDERYRGAGSVWSGNPNLGLVQEAAALPPGTALDVGCGEGADAHWLAGRGWTVTALDISEVALRRAAARTDPNVADAITWVRADLAQWRPDRTFDLVSAQYAHFPTDLRRSIHERLAAAVAPGGTLLIVGHHPRDLESAIGRPPDPDLYWTAAQLATEYDPATWQVVTADARPRRTADPAGHTATVGDTVLRLRRTPVRASPNDA